MKYNFDEIVERRKTGSVKWDFGEGLIKLGFTDRFDEDTLPLFTADMDFAVAPKIVEAMHRVVDQRIYGYTMARPEYYQAIIDWFQRRFDWTIKPEEITYCSGTVFALNIAIRAYSNEGDGVIIQRPVYGPFTKAIESNNRVVANNQMIKDENGYYHPDLKDFEEKAKDPNNKIFILCSPHNPSGRIFNTEDLKAMAKICYENNVVFVSDEIHCDLIRKNKKFTTMAVAAPEYKDNLVTCTGINKTFNVAGLHATHIIISSEELRNKFVATLGGCMPTPFTYNAVIAAYNECEDWLEELKEYLDGNFNWVDNFLKTKMPKVKYVIPEGTYVFWMDFSGYGISTEEIRRRIYVDANVILESGTMFDPDAGAGYERICLSSPRSMIQEAFERIAKAFADLE
ncbi:MAG: MalY/PatB family protein [Erysipelotrichaceae bacterium]